MSLHTVKDWELRLVTMWLGHCLRVGGVGRIDTLASARRVSKATLSRALHRAMPALEVATRPTCAASVGGIASQRAARWHSSIPGAASCQSLPQAGADARQEGGAERRGSRPWRGARCRTPRMSAWNCIRDRWPRRRRRPAARRSGTPAVGLHGAEQVGDLEGDALERGARQVGARWCRGSAPVMSAARLGSPVRRAQAGQGRHEVRRRRSRARCAASASISAADLDDAEPVAQPLHRGAGDERRCPRARRRTLAAELQPTVVSRPCCDGTGVRRRCSSAGRRRCRRCTWPRRR